ncbi:MAG: VOC family protein [Nitrosomonadales bacterium]|nr:VOC family protein [Nitrosomonadales bacterium]
MQKITPFLWFDKEARAAAEFYVSVFRDAQILDSAILKDTPSGTVEVITLRLFGQEYQLMSASPSFKFSEAISFVVNCETQEETDYYWEKLSAVPEAEACGWLKDKFGVSWQITPKRLPELLNDPDPAKAARVMQAVLQMKKIDIASLQQAYDAA